MVLFYSICTEWDHHLIVVVHLRVSMTLELCRPEFCAPGRVTHAEQVEG